MTMSAPDYRWLFTEGGTFSYEGDEAEGAITVVAAGDLAMPTGRVVACDPLVDLGAGDLLPFTAEVPPGRYPVSVAVVTITRPSDQPADPPHQRVAAAWLAVRDTPAVTWEPALCPGQDASELDDDEAYGYGVDTGTGCFVDAAAEAAFAGNDDQLVRAFEECGPGVGSLNVTDPATGHNVVAFTSGWGDGFYPTWIGRDHTGEVSCFVTDFLVVPSQAIPVTA